MSCPKCFNRHLMIRLRKGWERIMIVLTHERKYVCVACGHVFRAPDRRRVPRERDEARLHHGISHRAGI